MVHVIPPSVGQLRPGNVARYPVASPAGGAMQQVGDEWQAVAERYEQRKAQQQAFDTEIAARRLNGELAQAEADAVANAPADGAGLHDAMYGQINPHSGQVVKTGLFDTLFSNFVRQAPDDQRPGLLARKETLRAAGSLRMAMQQLQRRNQYEHDQWTAVRTAELNNIAQSDPNDTAAFDATRQTGLDLLARMNLDPEIRLQAEADWRASTAKARMEALIAQDPRRAAEMLSAAPAASDGMGETLSMQLSASQGEQAATKGDWRRIKTPDEVIAQAFRDDVPGEDQQAIRQQANAANLALKIKIGAAISRAEAEAADETARTGSYSGEIPGEDAYKMLDGPDKGPRRRQDLEWQVGVGKKIFDMGTMSNHAIAAAIASAEAGSNASPAGQGRDEAIAIAGKMVLERRRVDSGGYVSDLSPDISSDWKAVFDNGPSDPGAYDQDTYDRAIELSIAHQRALGIADEDLQPVPFLRLQKLAEDRDSGSMDLMDNYAKVSELFRHTKGAVAQAALVRELDQAGLGGILPGGKPGLSSREVFRADAKAIGKTVANAGIGLANINDWIGYGMSGGTISPPDYRDAYYKPSNDVEKVMMRQAGDALGWAIPGPGVGRTVESAIPRAVEGVGSGAAAQAERSIATKSFASSEVANNSILRAAPHPIAANEKSPVPSGSENDAIDMALTRIDVPAKKKRPFEWDYPIIPDYDPKTGTLNVDTAGDRLDAWLTAGRRKYKGADKGLNFDQFTSLARKIGVSEVEFKTLSQMREIAERPNSFPAGALETNKETGNIRILIRSDLSDREKLVTLSHEISHSIYQRIKSNIDFKFHEPELRRNYQEMRVGRDGIDVSKSPENAGYSDEKVEEELIVNGIAAALVDPNYGKIVEPKFYAAMQQALKNDPFLRQLVQLNSLLAAAGGVSLSSKAIDKSDSSVTNP
jgi:hypothetical protein